MPVSGFGGTCYEGAYEKTPNFEIFKPCVNIVYILYSFHGIIYAGVFCLPSRNSNTNLRSCFEVLL
jgi:hypothetical protein